MTYVGKDNFKTSVTCYDLKLTLNCGWSNCFLKDINDQSQNVNQFLYRYVYWEPILHEYINAYNVEYVIVENCIEIVRINILFCAASCV